jgi:hypothetical protein
MTAPGAELRFRTKPVTTILTNRSGRRVNFNWGRPTGNAEVFMRPNLPMSIWTNAPEVPFYVYFFMNLVPNLLDLLFLSPDLIPYVIEPCTDLQQFGLAYLLFLVKGIGRMPCLKQYGVKLLFKRPDALLNGQDAPLFIRLKGCFFSSGAKTFEQ